MSDGMDSMGVKENRLLAALPPSYLYRLLPHLKPVSVAAEQVLCAQAEVPEHTYFLLDSVVSLISTLSDGKSVELAMIGNDGATGIFGVFGAASKYYEYRVQIPGRALRIKSGVLKREIEHHGALPAALMRYIPALCAQISQVAACNRLHKVEQRLSTWLTMMHNRVKGDEIKLRQSDIARTLGYRRPTITEVCIMLQKKGAIRYSRGRITVLDRQRLEEVACECYDIMESQVENIYDAPARDIAPRGQLAVPHHLFGDAARISERVWRDHEQIRLRCEEQIQMIAGQREWLKDLSHSR